MLLGVFGGNGLVYFSRGSFLQHVVQILCKKGDFQFCWRKGAYLAEIKSKEEEELLDQFLIQGTTYWIGLDDLATEGRKNIISITLKTHQYESCLPFMKEDMFGLKVMKQLTM